MGQPDLFENRPTIGAKEQRKRYPRIPMPPRKPRTNSCTSSI